MLRAILIIVAILGAIVLAVIVVGFMLPVGHVATRSATFKQSPAEIYTALTDVESFPKWRSSVDAVAVIATGPPKRWREKSGSDEITFEIAGAEPPLRLVTRIADPDLPFGGSWTYELAPEGSGTRLTITEDGEVYNPIFRFMSRFVFGHTATMDRFLADLKKRVG